MEENKKSIFRKETLDRISSPEELDGYLKVTGPGIWITLIAIIVLMVGAFCWMIFGRLETNINVAVLATDGQTICLVPAENAKTITKDSTVKIADKKYQLVNEGLSEQVITNEIDVNIRLAGSLKEGDIVVPFLIDKELKDGIYKGSITLETVKPISFIIN